jgi:hypothetical protein
LDSNEFLSKNPDGPALICPLSQISASIVHILHHDGDYYYYDCLEGRGVLSRGPKRKSLRAIRANHITIGTRDTSEKTTPITPAVGGTNANLPADNPAYPVTLLKRRWLRSMTADTVRMARALRT